MGVAKSASMSTDLQHMRQLEKQVTGCVDTLTTTCLALLNMRLRINTTGRMSVLLID